MKINNLVEEIFATAVALDQSGGLRNTIYAVGNEVFIMNYDYTVLLRFRLRATEGQFDAPIAFRANDYDSNTFEERDGKIIFFSERGEYTRKKTCGVADLSPAEVQELYSRYRTASESNQCQKIQLSKDVLELLDTDLSHVEFSGDAQGIRIIQRNIYSGGVIEIQRHNKGFFKEQISLEFGPVAIKTDDFRALFTFQDVLNFTFPERLTDDFIVVQGVDRTRRDMTGIVACCLYDEVIEIREALNTEHKPKFIRRT